VVLHRCLPERNRFCAKAILQRVCAESAEDYRCGAEQCADRQERLQAVFLAFFFGLCGRFLP